MSRLAGTIDGVIGVDTHRDTLAAAATDPVGGLRAQTSATAPGWPSSCKPGVSGWWRSPGPSVRRGAAGPRATP
jgi:hypothetical protein